MSDTGPSTTPYPEAEDRRSALLREITRHGVTHGTPAKPIVSRDGRLGTSWVMSFLGVGLREPWLSDACDLLLERLRGFEGKQLATMGLGASSLLSGCVLRSGGTYNGLIVREEAKAHGSAKQIEGLPDLDEPVIIIDDAIGTGHSALKCAQILEANGFEVEGVLCAVRFTYDSGFGLLEENGYRVAALYDVYDDLVPMLEPENAPDPDTWRPKDILWLEETAPEGLSPFALARHYLHAALTKRAMPRPPRSLAMPLPCEGGLWVSLRRMESGQQVARMGSWMFPGDTPLSAPAMLAEACWMFAKLLPGGEDWLQTCGLALSVFGPLEPCTPGEIDNTRFGIVARSRERAWVVGAALPDMPGIHGDGHQLRHAFHVNGRLRPLEPFALYRHSVDKLIEPGAPWPPRGVSQRADWLPEGRDGAAQRLIERARKSVEGAGPEAGAMFLLDAEYLFLSLYAGDEQVACVGFRCRTLADFDALVTAAMNDPRVAGHAPGNLAVRLTALDGGWSQQGTPPAFCSGVDALCLTVGERDTILLPEVAVDENLDAAGFQALLLSKAGVAPAGTHIWRSLDVTCWDEGRTPPSAPSFRVARSSLSDRHAAAEGWTEWLATAILQDTLPDSILPLDDERLGTAETALRDVAIWRVAQVADAFAPDFHAVPRTPVYGLLYQHAQDKTPFSGIETLVEAVLAGKSFPDARKEPEAFWLSLRALAAVPEIAGRQDFAALLKGAQRRLDAPALPSERLLRLAALCTLMQQGHGAMHEAIAREVAWVMEAVSAHGIFITAQKDIEETLLTAHAAEALALAGPLLDPDGLMDAAGRCLDSLTSLTVRAPGGGAVVRSSSGHSGSHTTHTIAALGAYAAWRNSA